MVSESVSSVVMETLENSRKTGKSVIESYRNGSNRLANGMESGWEKVIDLGASRLDKKLHTKLVKGGKKVRQLLSDRVAIVADTAGTIVDKVCGGAAKAIETVTSKVEDVDNKYANQYFTFVGKAMMPSAKLARILSARVADSVGSLYHGTAITVKAPRKVGVKRAGPRAKRSAAA
jgi:hypothetical protein